MYTLLFEILDNADPTPRKRYLFCNDDRYPRRVTECTLSRARYLAALLSQPRIIVTVIDYATAAETYTTIETATPSRETQANGQPRKYEPTAYAVQWPVALDALDANAPTATR